MKKILCTILAIAMLFGCMLALSACDANENSTGNSESSQGSSEGESSGENQNSTANPEIPAGYKEYNNGAIAFAYPDAWTMQDGSTVILQDTTTGNNITVVYEAKTDFYESMTVDTFNSQLKPSYDAAGLSVSNVEISKTTANGLSVVKLSHNTTASGITMKQTQYISTVGDKTYVVTVTEVTEAPAILSTVLDTLHSVK